MAFSLFGTQGKARPQRSTPYEGKDTRGPCPVLRKTIPTRRLVGAHPCAYTSAAATDIRKTFERYEVLRNADDTGGVQTS
jgi:hypothetical protein